MDLRAHYQALYTPMAAAIDPIPVVHVFAGDTVTGAAYELPYVVYRQEVERPVAGTPEDGPLKVMRSNWVVTAYSYELGEALDLVSDIINALTDADIVTSDGYTTTALEPNNVMSLWEQQGKNYAVHVRFMWERSI